MPRSCSVCAHKDAGEIAKAIARDVPLREISVRYSTTLSATQRHAVKCLRTARKAKTTGQESSPTSAGDSFRFDNGRCSACGLSSAATEPEALLRRAERLLWLAETIAAKAQKDDDARLALQAVDRARASMETMMRATGMIGGDGAVTVNVDNRKLAFERLASLPDDFVARMAAGDRDAIDAVIVATQSEPKALPVAAKTAS